MEIRTSLARGCSLAAAHLQIQGVVERRTTESKGFVQSLTDLLRVSPDLGFIEEGVMRGTAASMARHGGSKGFKWILLILLPVCGLGLGGDWGR